MTRLPALLAAALLSACSSNGAPPMVTDGIAHWHDDCDWQQLAGKVARVEWHTAESASQRCSGKVDAFAEARRMYHGPHLLTQEMLDRMVELRRAHDLTWDEIVCIPGDGETINSEGEIG